MGGKIFGFPWKNFATCKLKRVGKKCAKEGAKMIFNSSNSLKNLISKNLEILQQGSVLFDTPPPTPLILFGKLLCGLGFLAWNGIVTLWTSTSAKGGVCGEAVHFFLADGDLQQRE